MPATISQSEEAEKIAQELIVECHPHLREAKVLYLMTTADRKHMGNVILASAQKVTNLQRFLTGLGGAEADFIILFSENEWMNAGEARRKAIVDHELSHCGSDGLDQDGNPKWKLVPHDVEEFSSVIARHGLYTQNVRTFADTVRQLTFEFQAPAVKAEAE